MIEWSCDLTCTIEVRHPWVWLSGTESVDHSVPAIPKDLSHNLIRMS